MRTLLSLSFIAACTFSSPIVGGAADAPPTPGHDGGGLPIDAMATVDADPCDDPCAAANGNCNNGTCEITVTNTDDVTCPAGLPCHVICNANGACDGKVDCSRATSCTIDCAISNTCNAGNYNCRGPGCIILCRQPNTCNATRIDITGSSCDLECCTLNTCNNDFASPQTCSFGTTCP